MRLTYIGHSTFVLETSSHRIVFDPFFEQNPTSRTKVKDLLCDYILVSHGHSDHCSDAVKLALRTGATIVANFEICEYFAKQGAKTHAMNPGGAHDFPFGRVKLVPAIHTSSFDGEPGAPYAGIACGVLVTADGNTIYHAGDTALFTDMKLIGAAKLDLALLPIGDNFTMGPDDALTALSFLKPKLAVPMHYNTWPVINQDAADFAQRAKRKGYRVNPLKPGESLELPAKKPRATAKKRATKRRA
ncbi:MAG: metal-dependent hydrolase [Opitutus sp.]|nr:metal-dependent hydrolase [Opitutus sp.]